MKIVVVDASFILSFLFPDEETNGVNELVAQYGKGLVEFIAPTLLPFEVLNGILSALLRKRISAQQAHELAEEFTKMQIRLFPISSLDVLTTAQTSKLSIYDAAYAWLAKSNSLEIMTHDSALRRAARGSSMKT